MPLIKSISGIRGTVGDDDKENLSPLNIKKFVISYCQWILLSNKNLNNLRIVTGRDGRESGPEIHKLVNETIISLGINVLDLGLSTTPSVGFSIPRTKSQGGIIITASHNPKEWRGRVSGSDNLVITLTMGISTIIAGLIMEYELLELRETVGLTGIIQISVGLF